MTPTPVLLNKQYAFGNLNSLAEALGFLITPAFSIAAAAVVIYFAIGGVKYLISSGDKNAVSEARAMMTHALIGFILLMMLFLILQFIPEFLGLKGFKIVQ